MKIIATAGTMILLSLPTLVIAENVSSYKDVRDAKEKTKSHLYIGSQIGLSDYNDSCETSMEGCSNDSFSHGIYTGYQLNEYFALEGGVNTYNHLKSRNLYHSGTVDLWGADLAIVFSLPVSNHLSIYTKVGGAYNHIEKEINGIEYATSNDWDVLTALGLDYRITQNLSLRGEYKYIDGVGNNVTGQADVNSVMLGLTYRFLKDKPCEKIISEPVNADEKRYTPVVKKLSLSSQALFDFDSAELKYHSTLSQYAQQLNEFPNGKIKITGYTDSVGNKEYNQKLSELRASSVAEYLIKMGVNESRIEVEGRGAENFKATNNTEIGRMQNRRVEIDFQTQVKLAQ